MTRTKPPFRADVVGSLLRTAPLKDARAKREKGEIDAAQLAQVEDREIEKIIKKQEEVGLKCATAWLRISLRELPSDSMFSRASPTAISPVACCCAALPWRLPCSGIGCAICSKLCG